MAELIDRIENHQINSQIRQLEIYLEEAIKLKDLTVNEMEHIDRLRQLHSQLNLAMKSLDILLVPGSSLNNISSNLDPINVNLKGFIDSKNISYLNQIDSNIDTTLVHMSILNNVKTPIDVDGLRDSLIGFRRSLGQHKKNIDDEYQEISKHKEQLELKLTELKDSIEFEKRRIDETVSQAQNQISGFQSQFSEAQESRIKSFEDFKESLSDELQNLKDEFTQKANDHIMDLDTKYQKLIEGRKEQEISFRNEVENKVKGYIDIFENHKKDIEGHKKDVEKLVGAISNTGMVSGYQRIANQDRHAAKVWNIISIISIIGLIGFAIYAFIFTVQIDFSWSKFAGRLFVSSTFATLVAYSAKQATKHQNNELFNRKMELELASIDPFLAVLPDEQKNKIKETLAGKLFGQTDILSNKSEDKLPSNPINSPNSSPDLFNLVLENLLEFLKKR